MEQRKDRPLWGNIVSLCSGDAPPKPEQGRLYIKLDSNEASIFASTEDYKAKLKIEEDDPFLLFFGDIYRAIRGFDLSTKQQDQQRLANKVRDLRIAIFSKFKTRPRLIERPQGRIIASWMQDADSYQQGRLPDDTNFRLMGGASRVFGMPGDIEGKDLKWISFIERLKATPTSKLQIHTLHSCLVSASDAGAVDRTGDGLLPTPDYQQVFRLVLNTCTTYYDGRIEVNLGLVEVKLRPDVGNEETTTLLKGLRIVCRFRSLFLERDSELNFINFEFGRPENVLEKARRLGSELDAIVCDCAEAKLDDPARWLRFVDAKDLQEMNAVWHPLNEQLINLCDEILSITDVSKILAIGHRISLVLQDIVRKTPKYNAALLKSMAQKLVDFSLAPTAAVSPPPPTAGKS